MSRELLSPAQGGGFDTASVPATPEPPLAAGMEDRFRPKSLAPDYVAQIERLEAVILSGTYDNPTFAPNRGCRRMATLETSGPLTHTFVGLE